MSLSMTKLASLLALAVLAAATLSAGCRLGAG